MKKAEGWGGWRGGGGVVHDDDVGGDRACEQSLAVSVCTSPVEKAKQDNIQTHRRLKEMLNLMGQYKTIQTGVLSSRLYVWIFFFFFSSFFENASGQPCFSCCCCFFKQDNIEGREAV